MWIVIQYVINSSCNKNILNTHSDNHFFSGVKTDLKGGCLDTRALRNISGEMRMGRREDT